MARAPKIIWENYRVIAEVLSSDFAKYQIAIAAKGGIKYICIRQWYMARKDVTKTWKPSWAGITIPLIGFSDVTDANGVKLEREVAQPVIDQLLVAMKELEDFDLFDEDHVVLETKKED